MEHLLAHVPGDDAARLARIASLADATAVAQLAGGITNRNYRVSTPGGDVVVRLSDPESSALAIDRENEYLNSVAAAASGAGAEVFDYLRGEGVLVVRWVEGHTLTEDDVRDPANLPRIAAACRVLHGGPPFTGRFDMFDVQARYLTLVRERGYRLPQRYLDVLPRVEGLRSAMRSAPEALVPCNNDLLPANMIDEGPRIRLIDYEYAGTNEASFELGNIWSESTLADDLLPVLVDAYWDRHDDALVARARLWAFMAQYGWTLWASIQDAISPLDFDYWSWGMEKYERALELLGSPHFDRLSETVAIR